MESQKILLNQDKVKDIKFYLPEEKTCYKLADFFSIFSDTTRIKILSALAVSEMCVNDISRILNINQTTVSHQLKLLKGIGAVKFRRSGKIMYYSLASSVINDCLLSGVDYLQAVQV
ncbi:MAG TPA: transcriptional regulator [Clostridiales bacterium]|nr:transcriptional regulator [Clostridiales bacterium]